MKFVARTTAARILFAETKKIKTAALWPFHFHSRRVYTKYMCMYVRMYVCIRMYVNLRHDGLCIFIHGEHALKYIFVHTYISTYRHTHTYAKARAITGLPSAYEICRKDNCSEDIICRN